MPTLNPRVNVTLSPSLDTLCGQLAKLERVSKSQVLRELLEAAEPSLRQAVALMEAAKGASAKARANMAQDLGSSIKAAEAISELVLRGLASQTRDIVSEAEGVRGRRPARRAAAAAAPRASGSGRRVPGGGRNRRKDPPTSNRGVK